MNIRNIIAATTKKLESAGIPSARLDTEILLAFCLNCERLDLIKNPEMIASEAQLMTFNRLIQRRLNFEPVAYIIGRKAFWSLTLEVNPDVLIPRPDTEVIIEETLAVLQQESFDQPRILDVGTGSGAIALALAAEIPDAQITATDISAKALVVAQKNARTLGLEHRLTLLQGDLFEPVDGKFDLIVSNPPYIGAAEYETLEAGVKNFEPQEALLSGQTGLEFYEKLIYQAHGYLEENGWILLEIGAKQSESVRTLFEINTCYYDRIGLRADYAGLLRVIKGRRK